MIPKRDESGFALADFEENQKTKSTTINCKIGKTKSNLCLNESTYNSLKTTIILRYMAVKIYKFKICDFLA